MKHEAQASKVVTAVADAVEIPVTCKLRLGVSKQSINVVSLSEKLVDAGAVALTIHGRSGEKKFGLPIDREIIKEAAKTLPVPIIANGGIYTGLDAQKILKETGAAAVMPGRGLLGNPWIVPEILSILSKHSYTPPILQEKKDICLEHLRLLTEFYGERRAVLKMRSILPHYFSSCLFLKDLKKDMQQATDANHIPVLIERIQEDGMNTVYRK